MNDETAAKLLKLAAEEPPWHDAWALPQCIGKLLDGLSSAPPFAIGAESRFPLSASPGLI